MKAKINIDYVNSIVPPDQLVEMYDPYTVLDCVEGYAERDEYAMFLRLLSKKYFEPLYEKKGFRIDLDDHSIPDPSDYTDITEMRRNVEFIVSYDGNKAKHGSIVLTLDRVLDDWWTDHLDGGNP